MRNVGAFCEESSKVVPARSHSMPTIRLSPVHTATPVVDEEEQAVAGRLEIRVVDASGGATVVQTSADKEPLQSAFH